MGRLKGGRPIVDTLRIKAMRDELLNNPKQEYFTIARPTLEAMVFFTQERAELRAENEMLRDQLKKYKGLQT